MPLLATPPVEHLRIARTMPVSGGAK
jgi:hypothetical protein